MRRIILLVLVFLSVQAFGQNPSNYLYRASRERIISTMVDSMFRIPRYNGTPSGLRVSEVAIDGAIAMDTTNGRLYIYNNGSWERIAKFSELTGGSIYVDSIWRNPGIDSFYWLKNGITYQIKDSSGGLQTWQQTLTNGSTLTGNNSISGGAFNFTFGDMGVFTVSQTAKSSVSGANGTSHVSPLTITGGNGGATSYSTGTVLGGNAGNVSVTAGNGGNITGSPTTGIGGTGGYIDLVAGDGGLGTTNGGTAGFVNIQGGAGGGGTAGGSAGYVGIKGGNAGSTGNADGGSVYIVGGIKNGSGADGHIFLGVSPSYAVRGGATIGSATKGDSLFNIKDGGLYADRGVRFPNLPSGSKSDSFITKASDGTLKYINGGDFNRQQDTIALASFGAGARFAADTAAFTDSTIYGAFYNDGSDTLMITDVRAVMNGGTSDTLGYRIVYNDTLNVEGTILGTVPLNNTTTGANADYDLFPGGSSPMKIPPGNWVWCKTPTVLAGRKPWFFSVTLLGYKKRR